MINDTAIAINGDISGILLNSLSSVPTSFVQHHAENILNDLQIEEFFAKSLGKLCTDFAYGSEKIFSKAKEIIADRCGATTGYCAGAKVDLLPSNDLVPSVLSTIAEDCFNLLGASKIPDFVAVTDFIAEFAGKSCRSFARSFDNVFNEQEMFKIFMKCTHDTRLCIAKDLVDEGSTAQPSEEKIKKIYDQCLTNYLTAQE